MMKECKMTLINKNATKPASLLKTTEHVIEIEVNML
jgi:hypothetical protein